MAFSGIFRIAHLHNLLLFLFLEVGQRQVAANSWGYSLLYAENSPIAICIITQPWGWYLFYCPMEGGRLSRPRQRSKVATRSQSCIPQWKYRNLLSATPLRSGSTPLTPQTVKRAICWTTAIWHKIVSILLSFVLWHKKRRLLCRERTSPSTHWWARRQTSEERLGWRWVWRSSSSSALAILRSGSPSCWRWSSPNGWETFSTRSVSQSPTIHSRSSHLSPVFEKMHFVFSPHHHQTSDQYDCARLTLSSVGRGPTSAIEPSCSWTSSLELSSDGPLATGLVIQPF